MEAAAEIAACVALATPEFDEFCAMREERWRFVGGSAAGGTYVLCSRTAYQNAGWYARRSDGRRFAIEAFTPFVEDDVEIGAVLTVYSAPSEDGYGWTVVHRSAHPSLRAAKAAAVRL